MANQRRWLAVVAVACGLLAGWQLPAAAAPPCDKIVPAGALGFFLLTDAKQSIEGWQNTHLGQLIASDPMQAFVNDIRGQIQDRWTKNRRALGINKDLFRQNLAGEVCLAVTRDAHGGDSEIFLFDFGPNIAVIQPEMAKADATLKGNGSTMSQAAAGGVTITIHTLPAKVVPKGKPAPTPDQFCWFIKDGMLAIATDSRLATEVLGRWGKVEGSLSTSAPYIATMKKCQDEAGGLAPNARWFIRPIELAEALRTDAIRSGDVEEPEIDYLAVLKKQGFSQVQGVGGYHNLASDKETSVLYRIAIHAPGKLQQGSRVLTFLNGPAQPPEAFVPQQLSTYASLNWDLMTAFDAVGSIVDEIMEEPGYFADLLKQIREEEDGPKIDVQKDLLAHLGTRVIVISDFITPFDGNSQRILGAVQCKNPAALAANLERSFENDPAVVRRTSNGVRIYEFPEREKKSKRPVRPVKAAPKAGPKGPPPAMAVVHGYLMITSRVGLLEKIIDTPTKGQLLGNDADYQKVEARILKMSGGQPVSALAYENQANDLQPTYELFKMGKLKDDNSPVGRVLKRITNEDQPGKTPLKGDKLPDFNQFVRPYFGPTGWYVRTTQDGWMVTGFSFVN